MAIAMSREIVEKARHCKEFHEKNDGCNKNCKYYETCITYENFVKSFKNPEPRPDQLLETRKEKKKSLEDYF
jgi:hypothetical protein